MVVALAVSNCDAALALNRHLRLWDHLSILLSLQTSLDASFGVSISVFRLFIPSLGKSEVLFFSNFL